MLEVSKPETIVKVRHLEKQLDEITLWPEHKNNVRQLTTRMMTIRQEIHAKSGATSYTDQRFIMNLFRALSRSPTEKFLLFVDQLKNQWIMEEITTSSDIIVKLDKMHKNMVANGSWVTTNKKDMKIVALTPSFQEICKKVGKLAKRVSFSGEQKGGGGDKKKNGGGKGNATDGDAKTTKTRCPEWQVTKKIIIRRTAVSTASACLPLTITTRGPRQRLNALRSSSAASETRRVAKAKSPARLRSTRLMISSSSH